MVDLFKESSLLYYRVIIAPQSAAAFNDWQANFHQAVASAEGFLSLEIIKGAATNAGEWLFTLRFADNASCHQFQQSPAYQDLLDELQVLLAPKTSIQIETSALQIGSPFAAKVTELFVTELQPNQEQAFREWVARIHQAEAKFPGFCGVYVQAPLSLQQAKHWITFLQFDSQENLDFWINSAERKALLLQSKPLIVNLESHRVISAYPGWFHVYASGVQLSPPLWKQALLILLVLFPVVMLEGLLLSPFTKGLNPSLAMFIGNFISVALVTWPLMPLVIYLMQWWLTPQHNRIRPTWISTGGVLLLMVIYALEIGLFA